MMEAGGPRIHAKSAGEAVVQCTSLYIVSTGYMVYCSAVQCHVQHCTVHCTLYMIHAKSAAVHCHVQCTKMYPPTRKVNTVNSLSVYSAGGFVLI